MDFSEKNALVVGMAKSGVSAAKLLLKKGLTVFCYDTKQVHELNEDAQKLFKKHKLPLLNNETVDKQIEHMDMLVLSPGVPETLPFIQRAYARKIRVLPEIELGYLCSKGEFVAISGTNGKTTTTALTGEIFKNAGKRTHVLGNIGEPICEYALKTKRGDVVVCETAAFQLHPIVDFHPRAAAVLNVTEDHLERFHTMDAYAKAKANIYKNQTKNDFAILNYDNEYTRKMAEDVEGQVYFFSRTCEVERGAFVRGQDVIFKDKGLEKYICNTAQIYIPGAHNLENALAACCLASCMGVSAQVIRKTFMEFKGVPHRIEFVREVDEVRYINDSKGTNPDATIKAVEAMKNPTVLILGGYDKLNDFVPLFASLNDNIKFVIALGATQQKLLDAANETGFKNIVTAPNFLDAVVLAKQIARPGYNVLLSPACASYDMFLNFEHRGDVFKEIVNSF